MRSGIRKVLMQGLLAYGVMLFAAGCSSKQKVDLLVHNARIYTVDGSFSVAEAMAISNNKIVAVGTNKEILGAYSGVKDIDAQHNFIYPGLIDAHCHFTGYATDMWKANLMGTASFAEVIEKVKAYAKDAPMEWIYGRGWDQNDWAVKEYPNKSILDSLFPNRPVFLKRIDGHAVLVNQKALDLAGITVATTVKGGEVEVKNGKLTGILIDNAMDYAERVIPRVSDSLAKACYLKAQEKCFANGLTGAHDCGVSEHTIEMVDAEQKAGRLKMKLYMLLSDSAQYYESWIAKGPYITDRIHVGGFKMYADGALGSRGACLLSDYTDKPGWKGLLLAEAKHYDSIAKKLAASKLQLCTHAIGDSGNRTILKIYASALNGKNDRRWRIEHAQVVNASDLTLYANNNIIPSVQPTHATSDMYWAADRLGPERVKTAYAYKDLLQTNGWIPLGTDFPIEDISPFKTFFAAVFRKDAKGFPEKGFQMENALTREDALRGMTIWAAKAAFEEKEKGSLEPGKWADFTILNTDLMKCGEADVLGTKVLATYINGERVYGSE